MGTRNLTVVISNNQTKVAQYGQWDGYPSGQGVNALSTLKQIMDEGQIETFREKVNALRWLSENEIDTLNKSGDPYEKHPYLSRDWGAKILQAVMYNTLSERHFFTSKETVLEFEILGLVNQEAFAADSLFCEWAYVVDLDKMTFEVYKGFNETLLGENERFAKIARSGESKYKPVKHVKTYDLNNLPSVDEFIKEYEDESEDN